MEGSAAMAKSNYQDFEDYVLPPLSPFTPYESTDRDIPQAGKAKANLSFTTVRVVHFFLVFCRSRLCHLSFFPRSFSHSFLSPLPFFVVCDLLGSGSSTRRSPSLPWFIGVTGEEDQGQREQKQQEGLSRQQTRRVQVRQVRVLPQEGKGTSFSSRSLCHSRTLLLTQVSALFFSTTAPRTRKSASSKALRSRPGTARAAGAARRSRRAKWPR